MNAIKKFFKFTVRPNKRVYGPELAKWDLFQVRKIQILLSMESLSYILLMKGELSECKKQYTKAIAALIAGAAASNAYNFRLIRPSVRLCW